MQPDRLHYLIHRFIHQQASRAEAEELALWIDTVRDDEEWRSRLEAVWEDYQQTDSLAPEISASLLRQILEAKSARLSAPSPIIQKAGKWWTIAASLAILLGAGGYIYYRVSLSPSHNPIASHEAGTRHDIPPGGNKATLTLGNGRQLVLDSLATGTLSSRGGARIVKLDSGELAYQTSATAQGQVEFNTLTTPRGGQYQLVLPDGSKVWLNAASSLRFPTAFNGPERRVTLRGEGYFEVMPPTTGGRYHGQPFTVTVIAPSGKTAEVKVLGTHFNINAYEDEPVIKTTLLEGAIKIQSAGQERFYHLHPGQQARMGAASVKIAEGINADEIIAWKNGLFDFEGIGIAAVMKQIARWYNVEVKYEKTTSAHFVGSISRSVPISGVLHMLEMTGAVHFEVEGNTVTVL